MSSGNIILLVVLVALLVLYPVLMMRRNKREQEKQRQLIESLKPGEYVLTYSGIFGKITEVLEKEVGKFLVIETGENKKNHITVSENAIYTVVNNNPKLYDVNGEEIKAEEKNEVEIVVAKEEVEMQEEPKEEPTKKSKTSSKSTKGKKD